MRRRSLDRRRVGAPSSEPDACERDALRSDAAVAIAGARSTASARCARAAAATARADAEAARLPFGAASVARPRITARTRAALDAVVAALASSEALHAAAVDTRRSRRGPMLQGRASAARSTAGTAVCRRGSSVRKTTNAVRRRASTGRAAVDPPAAAVERVPRAACTDAAACCGLKCTMGACGACRKNAEDAPRRRTAAPRGEAFPSLQ